MIHNPKNLEEQEKARSRISFDEILLLQLGLLKRKQNQQKELGSSIVTDKKVLETFARHLPFTLTKEQTKSISEIGSDMAKPVPMMRLLQGDVGSGKTVVAAASLVIAAANGYQGALMAPTEVLAEQHFKTLTSIFSQRTRADDEGGPYRGFSGLIPDKPLKLSLLTGSMPGGVKTSIQQLIRNGEVDIAIGTHSLIQKDVEFSNLGLAVVDEQHRFGVNQRASLREKGMSPHLLVMTATPIPRTLSLALYGDLDVTTISEMPPGRPSVKTKALFPQEREKAYNFIRKEIAKEHQVFIICPLVEESESIEAKAAIDEHERLQKEIFPDLKVGLLHGRMRSTEKESVISQFRNKELQILVSTAVIEVGIDIPNATVMMVEGAERFGLSQLHQYRGRVGRGKSDSYCILVSDSESPEVRERLNILETTTNGFTLSEADLQMRGPGEFFGTKQSGIPDLSLTWLSNLDLIEKVRSQASTILDADPQLNKNAHKKLNKELNRFWERAKETPEGG
jgi:ATP-dependent DNA helicase RecG